MPVATRPIATEIADLTPLWAPLWARESALDHRNLLIADEPERRLAAADALAIETAKTAIRVAIAVADPAAVNTRLAALRAQDLGDLRLLCASEALPGNDRAIIRGSFDLVVISIQRLGDLLTRSPQLAESLGMVVIDDVHTLLDPLLSSRMDRVLTLLRASALPPRLIALSPAGHRENPTLAGWLDATIEGETLEIEPDLHTDPDDLLPTLALEPIALQMIATERIGHAGELRRMMLTSFAGHACYEHLRATGDAREGFSVALDAALGRCLHAGVIAYRTGHGLVATKLGQLCLNLGLDLDTITKLKAWVGSLGTAAPSLLELSIVLARTRAAALAPAPKASECTGTPRAWALDSARSLGVHGRPMFRWLSEELWSCAADTDLALRRAQLLLEALEGPEDPSRDPRLAKIATAFARPLLAIVALYRQSKRSATQIEALLRAARRLDPSLAGFALRSPERRPRATPPKPARTRGPTYARTRTRTRTKHPQSTTPRHAACQVSLFTDELLQGSVPRKSR